MKKILCFVIIGILAAITFSGCTKVRFTTGLTKNEFAKIGGQRISMKEASLLLAEQKYSYEKVFDTGVWEESVGDSTTEEYVKNEVKDTIYHITLLNILADDMDISLTSNEKDNIEKAAEEYYATLDSDKDYDFTQETVYDYYYSLLRAQNAFYSSTDTVDKEVSEDEARIIDVQYIFVSTEKTGEDDDTISMTENEKRKKYSYAEGLLNQIQDGSDFVSLAQDKSDSDEYFMEFGTGDFDENFTKAAFSLEVGEVSDVVEGKSGYYIIKCISDNVDSDYNERSKEIVLKRRKDLFEKLYTKYVNKTISQYNRKYYKNDISTITSGSGKLNEIYNSYFVSTQKD